MLAFFQNRFAAEASLEKGFSLLWRVKNVVALATFN